MSYLRWRSGLTGGTINDLDGIDGSTLSTGDVTMVTDTTRKLINVYVVEDPIGVAESSPFVILPDTNPGTKGHRLYQSFVSLLIDSTLDAPATAPALDAASNKSIVMGDGAASKGDYNAVIGGKSNTIVETATTNDYGVIAGGESNSLNGATHGAVIGGKSNVITNATHASITGGLENTIGPLAKQSHIGGGYTNEISNSSGYGEWNVIGGGNDNKIAQSNKGFIGGGNLNLITGCDNNATVGGGYSNEINASNKAVIAGGDDNSIVAAAHDATIGGGYSNSISDSDNATISGGYDNTISQSSDDAVISGGRSNQITGTSPKSAISGGNLNTIVSASTEANIGGGYSNNISASNKATIAGGDDNEIVTASHDAFVGGGYSNSIGASDRSAIVAGNDNAIASTSDDSVIGAGYSNSISSSKQAVIVGGYDNTVASSEDAAIVAGRSNLVDYTSSQSAIVAGNDNEISSCLQAFIGGGYSHLVTLDSNYAAILGGNNNTVTWAAVCAAIGGGQDNETWSPHTFIGGGKGNKINTDCDFATIISGFNNEVRNGKYAQVSGRDGSVHSYGDDVRANGMFATKGDAQIRRFILRNITTDAAETALFLDGLSILPVLSDNFYNAVLLKARITARHVGDRYKLSECAVWEVAALLQNIDDFSITYLSNTPTGIGTPAAGNFTDKIAAQGTITFSGLPVADETFTINGDTYTWKAARAVGFEITIGVDAAACVTNLISALLWDPWPPTYTAAAGAGTTVIVTAMIPGTGGNSIVFTEACTNMAVDGSGTLGATTAGADSGAGTASTWEVDLIDGQTAEDSSFSINVTGEAGKTIHWVASVELVEVG